MRYQSTAPGFAGSADETKKNAGVETMAKDRDDRLTLDDLEVHNDFVRRHIGPGKPQIKHMLDALGYPSVAALIDTAV
jgi:hypothetical protein